MLVIHTRIAHYFCCVHDTGNQEHENTFVLFTFGCYLLVFTQSFVFSYNGQLYVRVICKVGPRFVLVGL